MKITGLAVCRHLLAALMFLLSTPAMADELSMAEAVRLALERNPAILIRSEQVGVAQARRRQVEGDFDLLFSAGPIYDRVLTPAVPRGTDAFDEHALSTGYQASISKLLSSGMRAGMTFDALSVRSSIPGTAPGAAQNVSRLGVTLTAPLLKNGGASVTRAPLETARLEVLSSRYELRSTAAQSLYDTIVAYWECRAGVELKKIAARTEERSRRLLESIRKLADAGETPKADLVLIEATRSDRTAETIATALALAESKRRLGRLLGIGADAVHRMADPADPFPLPPLSIGSLAPAVARLSAAAIAERPELRALAVQMEAAQVGLNAADKRLGPRLDLLLGVAYSKASEGGSRYAFVNEPGRIQAQPSVYAKLNYQFAAGNNTAIGAFDEQRAIASQISLRQRDTMNAVSTGVASAIEILLSSAEQLRLSEQGLVLYETAVEQEVYKQKNGVATLIDIVATEERFNNAQVKVLQLQLTYVKAVAKLKFETATLLRMPPLSATDPDSFSVNVDTLLDLEPVSHIATTPANFHIGTKSQ